MVFRFAGATSTVRFIHQLQAVDLGPSDNSLVVCDQNTAPLLPAVTHSALVINAEEEHKNWNTVACVLDAAHRAGLDRSARFTAVGGGVLCDIVAFAASIYLRGVALVLIPTTLVAMVDAALGGKTGIDHERRKNLIGSFCPVKTHGQWSS